VVGDVKGVPDNVEVAPERMDGNGYEKVEKINCVKAVVGLEGIGNGVQREGKCFVYLKHLIDYEVQVIIPNFLFIEWNLTYNVNSY